MLRNRCRVSAELASRVADAFELPVGYFPECRERELIQAIRDDPILRDRLYANLRSSRGQ